MRSTRIATLAAVTLTIAAVAACGDYREVAGSANAVGGGDSPAGVAVADTAEDVAAAAAPTATAALIAADVPPLGAVLTDETGRTLYRFDQDTARPPKATCVEGCAQAWPPVLSTGAGVRVEGVDAAAVGTVTRPDGSAQLTVNGWPLYRFSGDSKPGDTNGHGVRDVWFAANPQGGKAVAAPPAGSAPAASVSVMRVDPLGDLVVDERGMTLYRFDRDSAQPPTATCAGDCAKAWPPLLTGSDDVRVTGIDPALVGTVARPDGTKQVTIAGWPVYRFAQDAVPCDTEGHGVGGVWFAITPTGAKA